MLYFIFFLIFVCLLLDRYVYVRRLKKSNTIVKALYFSLVTIIYLSLGLVMFFRWIPMSDLLWLMFAFLIQAFSKLAYFLVSVWGYLRPRFNNRGGIFDGLGMLAAWGVILVMAWGTFYVRNTPRIEELVVESDRLPESFDGFKIAFFTDLHVGSLPDNNKLVTKLVENLNNLQADLVLFGGDLVNVLPEEVDESKAELLSKIEAKHGVYSVLGNHDLGIYTSKENSAKDIDRIVDRMLVLQKNMGWKMLENQTIYLNRGADSIALSGIIFPSMGKNSAHIRQTVVCDLKATYDSVPESIFNVMLSHTPEVWPLVAGLDSRADLTLAGHVHAMQSKLTIGKVMISPASLLYRFVSGIYLSGEDIEEKDIAQAKEWASVVNVNSELIGAENLTNKGRDKILYINDGFGYVLIPTRVGCAPEITIITLKSLK